MEACGNMLAEVWLLCLRQLWRRGKSLNEDYVLLQEVATNIKSRFFKVFYGPIRIPRIENRVPIIREIGSRQVHTGYLTFSLKKENLIKRPHFHCKSWRRA